MAFISRVEVLPKFRMHAMNSSHFVWMIGSFDFFESSEKIIFAYKKRAGIVFLALEPLGDLNQVAFEKAWSEFKAAVPHEISVWVAVYEKFSEHLSKLQFNCLKVGREPWIFLEDGIAHGSHGKGVRSAKNKALFEGARVEEWGAETVNSQLLKRQELNILWDAWRSKHVLELGGFLNSTDPLLYPECRRYFVGINRDEKIEGCLIATQIKSGESYYFEDLLVVPHPVRGMGELLTTFALQALKDEQIEKVSLGVVSVLNFEMNEEVKMSSSSRFMFNQLPRIFKFFYNFGGLETFRKRFKPREWGSVFLCVKKTSGEVLTFSEWARVMFHLIAVFEPRLNAPVLRLLRWIKDFAARYPLTLLSSALSGSLFYFVNRGGELPASALAKYGFSVQAPPMEWFFRTMTSDFLYFNPLHFWSCVIPTILFLAWAERTHYRKFMFVLFFGVSYLDDFIDFYAIQKPFHFFRPEVFHRMAMVKDVGGSLILSTLIGLQICQMRKYRELIFVGVAILFVLGTAFSSEHYTAMVLDLDHFVFLGIGYMIGKLEFEYFKKKNSAASKRKTPIMRDSKV